jgi:methylisocitrate lyase
MNTFQKLVAEHAPLAIPGVINAYCAILAEAAGFKALYLSGAGVANASMGLPDLGYTTLDDVLTDVKRIVHATTLPLLVDVDTGFDDAGETVHALIQAGAKGMHMEDQQDAKRCGHRPGKRLVSADEMVERLKSAIKARGAADFFIMARCDALANEGMSGVIARCERYVQAGCDALFVDAVTSLEEYQSLAAHFDVPVLANMTEFGLTPLLPASVLHDAGVAMVLYPLSAFRAMSFAAMDVYETLMRHGEQTRCLQRMQTREELYHYLKYYEAESKL